MMTSDQPGGQSATGSARGARGTRRALFIAAVLGLAALVPLALALWRVDRSLTSLEARLESGPLPGGGHVSVEGLPRRLTAGQTVYVPAYSHIYPSPRSPQLLSATLSVRNTDPRVTVYVTSVGYYGSAGGLVKEFLDTPLRLGPLASTDFHVPRQNEEGGSGANFLVVWAAEQEVSPPLVEAVMADTTRQQGIVFVVRGVVVPSARGE